MDLIAKPLEHLLVAITTATNNYGLSIVIFTILVRLAISPLNLTQLRSARAMSVLSPKLKELQKLHGKDREQLTKATMELYREHKVNPAAGCLPLIIQLPILWGLFNALNSLANPCGAKPGKVCLANYTAMVGGSSHVALYHAAFLWLPNLGKPDPWHILPVVAGIAQWVQSRMMMQPTTDPQQQQMNQIMQFMPLMIVVFAWNYASGLAVYWVVSTLFSIGLQYFVNRGSPNGPWGQLPVLGSGTLPSFLGGGGAGQGLSLPRRTTNRDSAATTARPSASRGAGRGDAPSRPTVISGRPIVQPRREGPVGGQEGDTRSDETQPGTRPRGPRTPGSRRTGQPAKGVRK